MVQYELIRQMPIEELLVYYNSLKAICENYEAELKPIYGSENPKYKIKWICINNEYQHAKLYFDVVLNALKYKSFHGLDEYEPKKTKDMDKPVSKPIPKKPVKPSQRGRKTKKKDND